MARHLSKNKDFDLYVYNRTDEVADKWLNKHDGSKFENKTKKYDAILLAAAPLAVPEYLYKSLEIGGRLISPIGNGSTQKLTLVTRVDVEEFKTEELEEVLFVPLLGGLID